MEVRTLGRPLPEDECLYLGGRGVTELVSWGPLHFSLFRGAVILISPCCNASINVPWGSGSVNEDIGTCTKCGVDYCDVPVPQICEFLPDPGITVEGIAALDGYLLRMGAGAGDGLELLVRLPEIRRFFVRILEEC